VADNRVDTGNSAAGMSEEDINFINHKDTNAWSGAERSIFQDYKDPTPAPTATPGPDLPLATEKAPDRSLSDSQAGYDQAAYDAEMDSDEDDGPTDEEKKAGFFKLPNLIEDAGASEAVPSRGPASVKEDPIGKKQLEALRAENVSESDIQLWRQNAEKAFREENVPEDDIKAYFGDPAVDPKPIQELAASANEWHAPMALPDHKTDAKPASGAWDMFKAGLEGSSVGLAYRGDLPDIAPKPGASLLENVAHSAGQVAGDFIPGLAASLGVGVGATAVTANPIVGAGAGAFSFGAVPAAMRKTLIDYYNKGQIKDGQDFLDRLTGTMAQAGKEGLISLVTAGAGGAGEKVAAAAGEKAFEGALAKAATKTTGKLAGEVAAMTVSGPAMEGRLPNKEDFENAAVSTIALHAAMHYTGKAIDQTKAGAKAMAAQIVENHDTPIVSKRLSAIWEKTGLLPHQIDTLAEQYPELRAELESTHLEADGKPTYPKSLDFILNQNKKTFPHDYVQMDLNVQQGDLFSNAPEAMKAGSKAPDQAAEYQTSKKVEVVHELPDSLGGGEVQLELNVPENPQQGLGVPGAPELPKSGNAGPEDHSAGTFQGKLPFADGAGRVPGEQLSLGVQGKEGIPYGTQLDLNLPEGTIFEDFRSSWGEQQKLPLPEGYDANRDAPGTQYGIQLSDGTYQRELPIEYTDGPKPKPFQPTEFQDGPKPITTPVTEEQLKSMSDETARKMIRDRIQGRPDQKLDVRLSEFTRRVLDEFDPILRIQKKLTGAKTKQEAIDALPASVNPYLLARNLKGVVGKAITAMQHYTFDYATLKKNGESLKQIFSKYSKSAEEGQKFEEFLVSARARELHARGIQTGIDPVAAEKTYQDGKSQYGLDAKRVVEFQRRILRYAVDSGLKSEEEYAAMTGANEHYVPFNRIVEKEIAPIGGQGINSSDPFSKIKGSERPIISPIEQIARNTTEVLAMAERNRTMRALKNLLQGEEAFSSSKRVEDGTKLVNPETGEEVTQFQPLGEHEVAVFEKGKREVFTVDADLKKAISGMDADSMNLITRILAGPASALRKGATLTPQFVIRNVVRDQAHAFLMSRNHYLPVIDFVSGLTSVMKHDDSFVEWVKGGGMASTVYGVDSDYVSKNIQKLQRDTGFLKTAWNVAKSPLELVELMKSAAEKTEEATRVGEFKRSKTRAEKAGATPIDSTLKAAFDARNVTLDFQKRGSDVKAINAIIPFWNAKNQGIAQIVDHLRERPMQMTVKAAAIMLPSLLLWAKNHEDPRYAELEGWEKALFWNVMTDNWVPAMKGEEGTPMSRQKPDGSWEINRGKIHKVSKPQELGLIYGSSLEAMLDSFKLHDPTAASDLGKAILGQVVPDLLPTGISVPVELMSNYDIFRNRNIVPYDVQKSLPHMRYSPYTTEAAKFLSRKLFEAGVDNEYIPAPAMVDHAVKGLFGGWGELGLYGSSYALEKMGATEHDMPEKDFSDIPSVKAFEVRVTEQSKSVDQFFSHYKEMSQWQESMKKAMKEKDANEILRLNSRPEAQLYNVISGSFSTAQKAMKELKKQVIQLNSLPASAVTRDERLRLTDALLWKRMSIAQSAIYEFQRAQSLIKKGQNPESSGGDDGAEE
jgi:hypothetical protein